MPLVELGILLAAVLAADPGSRLETVAQSFPPDAFLAANPAEQLRDLVAQALPPPPDRVVRETRYYGTVTIDHRAHLARRARCIGCHGPGQIRKITFTPRVAHERCVGCHREQAKGPTSCKECHVRKPEPPAAVQLASAASPPAEAPKPAEPDPANLSAAFAAFARPVREDAGVFGPEPFHRALQLGIAGAGTGGGFTVRVASYLDHVVVTQGVDRVMSLSKARTFGLLGAGISRPLHSGTAVEAIALAGFDAVDRPVLVMLPALGARAGLEWRTRWKWFQLMGASVTAISDLSRGRAFGEVVGGTTIYGAVSTGFSIPPK